MIIEKRTRKFQKVRINPPSIKRNNNGDWYCTLGESSCIYSDFGVNAEYACVSYLTYCMIKARRTMRRPAASLCAYVIYRNSVDRAMTTPCRTWHRGAVGGWKAIVNRLFRRFAHRRPPEDDFAETRKRHMFVHSLTHARTRMSCYRSVYTYRNVWARVF